MTEQEERLRKLIGFDDGWELGKDLSELNTESDGCHISSLITVDEGWDLHYKNIQDSLTEEDIEILCKYLESGAGKKYLEVVTKSSEMFIAMCEKEDTIGKGVLDA